MTQRFRLNAAVIALCAGRTDWRWTEWDFDQDGPCISRRMKNVQFLLMTNCSVLATIEKRSTVLFKSMSKLLHVDYAVMAC